MYLQYLFMMLITFICGVTVGVLMKGIHINITHKEPEVSKEELKAPIHNLPDHMRQYAEQNKGYFNL